MQKWEYLIIYTSNYSTKVSIDNKDYDTEPYINMLGEQGWELVLELHNRLFFKRKKDT